LWFPAQFTLSLVGFNGEGEAVAVAISEIDNFLGVALAIGKGLQLIEHTANDADRLEVGPVRWISCSKVALVVRSINTVTK